MQRYLKLFRMVVTLVMTIRIFIQPAWSQMPVRMGPASLEEIKRTKKIVEAYPDSLKVHRAYILAMGLGNPSLEDQYKAWLKKYPQHATIPLAVGTAYHRAEMPQARTFLLEAAKLQPQNAAIWSMLADDALMRGENETSRAFIKKAMLADSSNAGYAAAYLMSFAETDPNYKTRVFDFVKRFPDNGLGAQVLYMLALQTADREQRTAYFEALRQQYNPQKFPWSASGMEVLADMYMQTDPEKALTLISEMGDQGAWKTRRQIATSFIRVQKMEQEQHYQEALMELNGLTLPKYNEMEDFFVLKKAALMEKGGDTKAAYDSLIQKFSRIPTDELYAALLLYGEKIGKNRTQTDRDVEKIRSEAAVAAYPFELECYTEKGKLNLNDLKGNVVLLTFWFPGCAPCKAEFPHFEAVLSKFKDRKVRYLAINVLPEQDPYVLPLVKNNRYSFTPLRGSAAFADKYYGVQSEPQNFVIDKNGKIVFKKFKIDHSNHRTLELMISSLL